VKGLVKPLVREFLAPLAACELLFMCYYENQSDRRCRNGDVPERYRALFGKAPLPGQGSVADYLAEHYVRKAIEAQINAHIFMGG
jgi:hypothetical protein